MHAVREIGYCPHCVYCVPMACYYILNEQIPQRQIFSGLGLLHQRFGFWRSYEDEKGVFLIEDTSTIWWCLWVSSDDASANDCLALSTQLVECILNIEQNIMQFWILTILLTFSKTFSNNILDLNYEKRMQFKYRRIRHNSSVFLEELLWTQLTLSLFGYIFVVECT